MALRRRPRRYLVKGPDGQELVVPSLDDLRGLYERGFLADDDLVRSESAKVWVRAGNMPALHGVRVRVGGRIESKERADRFVADLARESGVKGTAMVE